MPPNIGPEAAEIEIIIPTITANFDIAFFPKIYIPRGIAKGVKMAAPMP